MSVNEGSGFNPAWGGGGGGGAAGSGWGASPGARPGGPDLAWGPMAGLGRPAAIALTVLGFILWWPVGLAALFYMIGRGRFGRGRRRGWQAGGPTGAQMGAQAGWMPPSWSAWKAWACDVGQGTGPAGGSGNHAFDAYRNETLKRLEDEQHEFGAFLERLRFAKDKAEFDQFMADRRSRPPAPPSGADDAPVHAPG